MALLTLAQLGLPAAYKGIQGNEASNLKLGDNMLSAFREELDLASRAR
ncbi:hypothetical protein [Hymenobacter psoromatis]|nr:hypothetical protein [Hymenobacter psoromatis]